MSAVSLQDVPSVTGKVHCGSKCCTRDILLTIFRSLGGRTTAYSYREDTVTSFLVTLCNAQARAIQNKQKAGKSTHAQSCKHIHTKSKPHTDACICMHTNAGMVHVNTCMYLRVHTNNSSTENTVAEYLLWAGHNAF